MTALEAFLAADMLNLVALLGVVFIGLPHGAMDGALAMHFGWTKGPTATVLFLLSYVGLAGLVVVLWALAPVLTFTAFLAISIVHFGRGDSSSLPASQTVIESLARGGVVIGGISQLHRESVNEIFQNLVGLDTSLIWLFLNAVVVLTAACVVVTMLFKDTGARRSFAIELGALCLVFLTAPPLLGFALYFCFVHAVRHASSMGALMQSTVSRFSIAKTTMALSLLTWGVGLVVLVQQTATLDMEPALLRVVFIGLAALTVPHMVMVDGVLHRERSSTDGT